MIGAVIYYGKNTLVAELPMGTMDLQMKLSSIGVGEPADRIPLKDDEERQLQVKLYASSPEEAHSGSISMYTDWSIPYIGIKDKEIRVYSDCYDATLSFTPKAWSDPQQDGDVRFMPRYQEDDVLQTVRTLWQDMYTLSQNPETKASDLYPYIAADAVPDTAQIILVAYRQLVDKDIKMTQAVFRTDGTTFWANDHCLAVNFGYEVTWGSSYNMRRLSSIILAREGEAWKIYRVTDSGLFSNLNYFTSEW